MDKLTVLLVVAVVAGIGGSVATSAPLYNVTVEDNSDGWFTLENIDRYGADLDARIGANDSGVVLTGHPTYVVGSDEARLLYDMPRVHYFAQTYNDTELGDRLYANLTESVREGDAKWAINNGMTRAMLAQNATLARAFETHYCRVEDPETARLYNETDASLYRWVPNESACPSERRADT